MAAEKADLPQDTDSLPPNYASSETYTDSPPPAYRKGSSVRLQVTRVVCFTVLAAGFLVGAFLLTHTWITTRDACHCDLPPSVAAQQQLFEASILPQVESLVGGRIPSEDEKDYNLLESSQLDQESRLMDIPLPYDEELPSDGLELAAEAMEDEEESLQEIVEEVQKKINLPVDLIMGNPALAGKDVQCKVEKKMQNLGAGILSKTIIVTCDDEDDNESDNPLKTILGSGSSVQPPMSLLAPIFKMMAARANARLQRQMQPKTAMRRFPQPMMNAPFGQQFPPPYPAPFDGPMPFAQPMMSSMPMNRGFGHGPINAVFAGPLPIPSNSIIQPNMVPMHFLNPDSERPTPFEEERRMPFHSHMNRPRFISQENDNMPFEENFDNNEEEEERSNMQEHEPMMRLIPTEELEPEMKPEVKNSSPIKVIHGFPPQMPEAIKQIVAHIMNRPNNKEMSEMSPIIKIKAIPESRMTESSQASPQKSRLLLPFPFRAIKLQREGRKLNGNEQSDGGSFRSAPFPLPRGAISSGLKPYVVPEAAGRALDSPVALPELPSMRFFPGRLLRLPAPLRRAFTHMEMKQNPNSLPNNSDRNGPSDEDLNGPFSNNGPDFGPPRLHTVIRGPPPMQDNIPEEANQLPHFLRQEEVNQLPPFPRIEVHHGDGNQMRRFLRYDEVNPIPPFMLPIPPPPPKFAEEGRSGIVREINPDAELVKPMEANGRHMIMVN